MSRSYRLILLSIGATLCVGLVAGVGSAAPQKPSNWGFICSRAEDKKLCCANKQIDCAAECMRDYTGDAINTCKKVCARKGKTCGNEIKAPAPEWEMPQTETPTGSQPPGPKASPPTQQDGTR